MSRLPIASIRVDGGTQTRAEIDLIVVADYCGRMQEGITFPPVVVFYDGTDHWLADGFHRVNAGKAAGLADIDADIRQGTRRDAILFSVGANAAHGLRRTNADKRRAVETLLRDEEWSKWNDREIARTAGVGNKFVGDVRRAICVPNTDMPAVAPTRTVERNGVTYQQNTANIGKGKPAAESEPVAEEPERPRASDMLDELLADDRDDEPAPTRKPPRAERYDDDTDADDEDGLVVAAPAAPIELERPRQWGASDAAASVARVLRATSACAKEVQDTFAHVDPRFSAEVRERVQDSLLNLVELIREHLPPTDATPRRAFGVIRGGK